MTAAHMTHRARVIAALNHREPDRVPLDFGTGTSSTTVPEAHERLSRFLNLAGPTRLMPSALRLSFVDERILRYLDIDTRPVMMRPGSRPARAGHEPGAFYDDFGVKWRVVSNPSGSYAEMVEHPLAQAAIEDLDSYPYWPDVLDPARYAGLEEEIKELYHNSDYAIIAMPSFNGVWEKSFGLRGFARLLEDLALNPEFVQALLRKVTDLTKVCLGKFLEIVGPYAQIIRLGDDLGSQHGPLMSPATYRKLIKPYQQEVMTFIKQRSDAKIWYHTCGDVYPLLPDIIDAGADLLNPVQVSARDMDPSRLKAEFGDRLCFCGAIDTQHVLPHGSVRDVKQEVERRIRQLASGGGYILTSVHNIQADVPPDNVVAMFVHARQVGKYPIRIC
jgi:uroporphyrinogen decarboxylase